MTDLRIAATAMLDTDGVHPGDNSWHVAYDLFFEKVKEDTVENAIKSSLDFLHVNDEAIRLLALARYRTAFDNSRQPRRGRTQRAARGVNRAVKTAGSKIHEAATAAPKS